MEVLVHMRQTRVIRRAEMHDIDALVELLATLFIIETDFVIDARRQQKGLYLMLEQAEQCCVIVAEGEYDENVLSI